LTAFVHNVVFDAEQPRRLGRFWSDVTGHPVADEREDFVRLQAPTADPDPDPGPR
jgi:Glyoxalase-like domain